jgi:GGDEF domain-containing protein
MKEKIAPEDYVAPISHDGVHDSLTYLAAPLFFYEVLHREIARADRDGSPLMIFRFTLHSRVYGLTQSQYEYSIITFANVVTSLTRDSDVTARIGRFEFYSLLPIDEKQALDFINRLIQRWGDQDFGLTYSFSRYKSNQSLLELLNQLDSAESTTI